MAKKYYWMKLKEDFFKRHDTQIIESMPNGKDYIIFYLKLLLESLSHEGALRFNENIPYSEDMLATITRTIKRINACMLCTAKNPLSDSPHALRAEYSRL